MIVLSATVLAQTGTEGIRRQVQKTKIAETTKQTRGGINVLVDTGHELVVIATRAAGGREVVRAIDVEASWSDRRIVLVPQSRCGFAPLGLRNLVVGIGRATAVRSYGVRIVDCNPLRQQRREVTLPEGCRWNCSRYDATSAETELLPTHEEERFVFDHRPANVKSVIVLNPWRRSVALARGQLALLIEVLVRIEDLITQIFVSFAVPVVGAGFRTEIQDAAGELTEFCAQIIVLDLELADGVLRRNR